MAFECEIWLVALDRCPASAVERAVYMIFLVAEVHPFDDGNGRLARVMMNAELVSGGQSRIIIPTVYRDDYLGALSRLTRHDDLSLLIKALRYAQDYTAQIDFSDREDAIAQLRRTNAFNEPTSDERLTLPRRPPATSLASTSPYASPNRDRVPRGIPSGGQFTAQTRARSRVTLTEPNPSE